MKKPEIQIIRLASVAIASVMIVGAASCRPRQEKGEPLTDTNAPRPTNEVAERIPWVTNPPPR